MKRFISLLSLGLILASNIAFTANAATTYSGVDQSNAFADYIIYSSAAGYNFEKTSEGNDSTGSNDVLIGQNAGSAIYLGFAEKFDGLSIDVGTSATGGKYLVEYWNGSSWVTLVSETTADIKNDSTTGVFSLDWDRPTDWTKNTINVNFNEEASTTETSTSLYYVRFKITSAYGAQAYADQFGILVYNVLFDLSTQLGTDLTSEADDISFTSSTGDTTIYATSNDVGDNNYFGYALYTPSSTSYTYTINVSGYVTESASVTLDESSELVTESLNYGQVLVARDPESSNETTIASAVAGSSSTTCTISSGRAYCPVSASADNSNATVQADGYAPSSMTLANRASDSDAQSINYLTLNYAYLATVKDEDGNYVSDATVEMGDSSYSIDCDYVSSGQYGCIVPVSNDEALIRISEDDSDTLTTSFSTARDSNSDAQVSQTFTLNSGEPSNDDGVDYDVVEMEWQDDGDFVFTVENEGDEDTDSDENVYIAVYVDGEREYYEYFENESGDSFLDSNESEDFNLGDDFLEDEDEEYEVEVCVDYTDTVDEEDESNNCLEDDLELDSNSGGEDGINLELEDMYLDDEDLMVEIVNSGDEDIDEDEYIKIYVYVDDELEYTLTVDGEDDNTDFYNGDDSDTINLGDNALEDQGSTYDVEVCVDVGDNIDETDEDDNCREEDEDELEEEPSNGDSCGDFVDIGSHWGEEYICNLYDRDVVEGYSSTYFKPDDDVSRAEFLKMALLGADLDPYDVDTEYYSDVDDDAWYYEYVTYASKKDYIEGYGDGTFRPNDDINRAEALVILFRIAGEDDYDYDSGDIDFNDVETYDWFAWAIVLADDLNIVDGYSNGLFGPANDLSRAEAAKIIDLAYEEFYND